MLYRISQFIGWLIIRFYFRIRIEGRDHIPTEGAYLVVANHASFLDPFLISIIVPRNIHWLTYAFFYYLPICHWYCKRVHCIPLHKDGKDISALKQALRLLKQGQFVGIFPEGIRSETGQLKPGEPGAALIALRAKTPILPIGIRGAYEAFPRGTKFPKPFCLITITFGKPFTLDRYLNVDKKQQSMFQEEVTRLIMSKIAELCSTQEISGKEMSAAIQ